MHYFKLELLLYHKNNQNAWNTIQIIHRMTRKPGLQNSNEYQITKKNPSIFIGLPYFYNSPRVQDLQFNTMKVNSVCNQLLYIEREKVEEDKLVISEIIHSTISAGICHFHCTGRLYLNPVHLNPAYFNLNDISSLEHCQIRVKYITRSKLWALVKQTLKSGRGYHFLNEN